MEKVPRGDPGDLSHAFPCAQQLGYSWDIREKVWTAKIHNPCNHISKAASCPGVSGVLAFFLSFFSHCRYVLRVYKVRNFRLGKLEGEGLRYKQRNQIAGHCTPGSRISVGYIKNNHKKRVIKEIYLLFNLWTVWHIIIDKFWYTGKPFCQPFFFFAKWNSTIIFTHSYFVFSVFFSLQYNFLGWSKLQNILSTGILQLLTSFKNSKWRKISYLNIDFIYRKCNFVSCYITSLTVLIPQRVSIKDKSILDQKYYLF